MQSPIAVRRPFQFRLRTALLMMSVCCIASLPLGYFVRSLQRPQRQFVPVSGVVTLNGQPLADANVEFVSDDPRRTRAVGITDSKGRFNLVTLVDIGSVAGAEPGDYTVVIGKWDNVRGQEILKGQEFIGAVITDPYTGRMFWRENKLVTPMRYADAATSGLRVTVSADSANVLDFDLTWD